MRALQILLTLFGALALLALGAVGAMASPAEPAPCHAMADHSGSKEPHAPKAAMAMGCCVACVAPAAALPTTATAPVVIDAAVKAGFAALPLGRSPSPEPGPPKA